MTRRAWLFLVAVVPGLAALSLQGARAGDALNDTQILGRRLFTQSCVVCHQKPQITSVQYGPVLSRESLDGQDGALREVISNGTPHMPGFKFQFEPAQIDAIIAYLKSIPTLAPLPPPAPRTNQRNGD